MLNQGGSLFTRSVSLYLRHGGIDLATGVLQLVVDARHDLLLLLVQPLPQLVEGAHDLTEKDTRKPGE